MNRIVFKNLGHKKIQSISLCVTIAITIAAFVALYMLGMGLYKGISLNEERSGADVLVVPSEARDQLESTEILYAGAPVGAYMQTSIADQIKEIHGVESVTVQFYGETMSESCCTADASTRIIGFDPESDWIVSPFLHVDISNGLAADEVIVGKKVTGYSGNSGKIYGNPVKVVGVLDETGSYLDNSILMNLDAVRDMVREKEGYEHYWEKYGDPDDLCSAILVKTSDSSSLVASKIKRYVEGDFSCIVQTDILAETQEDFNFIFGILAACGAVLVVASILQLISRSSTLVWDRRSELALYRALGATKGDLRKIISGEIFTIAIIGCVVGAILGYVAYVVMLSSLQGISSFPFVELSIPLTIAGIVGIVVVFLLITLLSILVPLRQVGNIDPQTAMSQVDIS